MVAIERPALLVTAPASGQGKTSLTAALARLLARQGIRVRAFKCGPDFLDPQWLALACGAPVDNLDLWINGEADVRARLWQSAYEADVLLIEGVMGLYDGQPSAADLALAFDLPVMAVISAASMAGTFAAIVHGLRTYRLGLRWAGVLANRVGSDAHAALLRSALVGEACDDATALASGWLGALPRLDTATLPERHLGLTLPGETLEGVARLDLLADHLARTPLGQMALADWQRWRVRFTPPAEPSVPPRALAGRRIAVARDTAFAFLYPANIALLEAMGAEVVYFSPLANEPVPACDAVWLPGGYPELHTDTLVAATQSRETLAAHVAANRPVWAECGGMMVLFERLLWPDGEEKAMWGLLPGKVRMGQRLAALGTHAWATPAGTLKGHTFHYSLVETPLEPLTHTRPANGHRLGEAIYQKGPIRASYFHAWFPSNAIATAWLFGGTS